MLDLNCTNNQFRILDPGADHCRTGCTVSDSGAKAFAEMLQTNGTLTSLNLNCAFALAGFFCDLSFNGNQGNHIGAAGCSALGATRRERRDVMYTIQVE
jgi:hypothetical protein